MVSGLKASRNGHQRSVLNTACLQWVQREGSLCGMLLLWMCRPARENVCGKCDLHHRLVLMCSTIKTRDLFTSRFTQIIKKKKKERNAPTYLMLVVERGWDLFGEVSRYPHVRYHIFQSDMRGIGENVRLTLRSFETNFGKLMSHVSSHNIFMLL